MQQMHLLSHVALLQRTPRPQTSLFTNLLYPVNPSKKAPYMIMSRKKLVGQTQNMFENIHV